jgi:hypothetical protein
MSITENNILVKLKWKAISHHKDGTGSSMLFHTFYFVNCKGKDIKIVARLVDDQEIKLKWLNAEAHREQEIDA